MQKKRRVQSRFQAFHRLDAAALVCFALITAVYLIAASVRIGHNDESFYYTVVQRFLQGDRPLLDEWQLSQASAFLLIVPYKLAYAICGGTQGIILTLRYLFLSYRAVFACWAWLRLRKWGVPGLIGEILYLAFTYMNIPTFGYYTFSMDGALALSLLLFLSGEPKLPQYLFAGVAAAVAAISEPAFIAAWPLYGAAALVYAVVRKLRRADPGALGSALRAKAWFGVTLGMLLVVIPFMAFVLRNSSFGEIGRMVPELLADSEHHVVGEGASDAPVLLQKLGSFFRTLGGPAVLSVAAVAALALPRRSVLKNERVSGIVKYVLAVFTCALALFVSVRLIVRFWYSEDFLYSGITPFLWFSLLFWLLCDKKPAASFGFWIVGLLMSVAIDASSHTMIGFGGIVAQICGCASVAQLWRELSEDVRALARREQPDAPGKRGFFSACGICAGAWRAFFARRTQKGKQAARKKKKPAEKRRAPALLTLGLCAGILSAAALLGAVGAWEWTFQSRMSLYPQIERARVPVEQFEPMDQRIEVGPQKGLRTTKTVKAAYEAAIADIDAITASTDRPLYIFENCPALYLHADHAYGCYSAWYVDEDFARQLRYWELYPDRLPEVVYLPYVTFHSFYPPEEGKTRQRMEALREHFQIVSTVEGRGGDIVIIA